MPQKHLREPEGLMIQEQNAAAQHSAHVFE